MIIFYTCIFFLGAVLASFINATLYRIENKYKYPEIFTQGSHCEGCKHPLSWIDLIPVLGFLMNKGKCKYCGAKVNSFYPISELVLGVSFLLFALYSVPPYLYAIILLLFILSYYDIKEFGIPKDLTHIFLGICIFVFILTFDITRLYLPILISAFLILLNILKKSFGMGDILIILGLGILMSQHQFVIFFWLAILIALLYSFFMIIKEKINIKKAKIPMLPFLAISFVLSIVYGEIIWTYILKLLEI